MKRFSISLALVLLACAPSAAGGQSQTVEYSKVFSSRTLSGKVNDQSRSAEPVKDALVEEMSEGWKTVLRVVRTDDRGFFFFPAPDTNRPHYLKISANGFNPLLVKVRVTRWTRRKFLTFILPVAT